MSAFSLLVQKDFHLMKVILLLSGFVEISKIQLPEIQVKQKKKKKRKTLFLIFITEDGQILQTVVALDAIDYRRRDKRSQFSKSNFERELNKAYIGFLPIESEKTPIATGNWVCFQKFFFSSF